MSFEQKLEQRFKRLELYIEEQLRLIEARLERRIERLERHEARDDLEVERLEHYALRLGRLEKVLDLRVDRLEDRLKPHHYPATRAVTVKPA